MLNMISFLIFSVLAGKLISMKAFGSDAVIMAGICGYMGIMDLLNTYSTLLTNGAAIALLSFALRGSVILAAVYLIKKYKKSVLKNSRKVIKADFSANRASYRRAS